MRRTRDPTRNRGVNKLAIITMLHVINVLGLNAEKEWNADFLVHHPSTISCCGLFLVTIIKHARTYWLTVISVISRDQ